MGPSLEPIIVKLHDGYVVIPKGMVLVFLLDEGNRLIAYVQDWTSAGEYDATEYDLYLLSKARGFIVPHKMNGIEDNQQWYGEFGDYTKEALKTPDGLLVRDRVS
jgi:hypothetical protein